MYHCNTSTIFVFKLIYSHHHKTLHSNVCVPLRKNIIIVGHTCSVRGVAIDGLNQVVITAGLGGDVKFWKFKQKNLMETLHLKSYISEILLHRER